MNLNYALMNLAAMYPASRVRDEAIKFKSVTGRWPEPHDISKLAGLGPRKVQNVWSEVAWELGFGDLLGSSIFVMEGLFPSYLRSSGEAFDPSLVHRALGLVKPCDACLIILRDLCECTEQRTLEIISLCSKEWDRAHEADAVDSILDEVTHQSGVIVNCPWDVNLFEIKSRGRLAVRLFRARSRLFELLAAKSGS